MLSFCAALPVSSAAGRRGRSVCRRVNDGTVRMSQGASAVDLAVVSVLKGVLSVGPLRRALMGFGRERIVRTAERLGERWREKVAALEGRLEELEGLRGEVEDPGLVVPSYYRREFHAYPEGNLGWRPAMEVDVSQVAIFSRAFYAGDYENGLVLDGKDRLRNNYLDLLREAMASRGATAGRIVDMGCSTGVSTFALQERFPEAEVVGVDLSSYMLAVAKLKVEDQKRSDEEQRKKNGVVSVKRLPTFVHGKMEETKFEDESFDLVCIALTMHELPTEINRQAIRESRRLLKNGGTLCIIDSDPAAWLRRPLYAHVLFQTTEPYADQFQRFDMCSALEESGFKIIANRKTTRQHRTVVSVKQ